MKINKVYPIASFKALESEGPGKFEAVVSVFGNVDLQGDRALPGMFKSTLEKWRKTGDPVPCIWSHDWLNPDAYIGDALPHDVEEIVAPIGKSGTGGLKVIGQMDVHKPFAGQVFDLLKSRRVKEWSFAYDTIKERTAKDGANELVEVDLIEFGPCLKGANPDTYTVGAKSALEKELEETWKSAKLWQAHIDRIANWEEYDSGVAKMLTRTYSIGSSPEKAETITVTAPEPEPDAALRSAVKAIGGEFVSATEDTATFTVDGHTLEAEYKTEAGVVELGQVMDVTEEKTEGKPWHVEHRGDEWCVIKDDDGEVEGCHDTEEAAHAQMRALYASESSDEADDAKVDETTLSTSNITPSNITASVTPYIITDSTSTTVTGTKAGRVVGAKAAAALKTALTKAVDEFVAEVNGAAREADDSEEEKSDDTLADIKARLDALEA